MPHVAFVPFTGFRVREEAMLELGMTLPGLRQRAKSISRLPALGLLTLAGMTPEHWNYSYHDNTSDENFFDKLLTESPDLVAVSALTASIEQAYQLCRKLEQVGIPVVIGGLHATTCHQEASRYCISVVIGEGETVWLQILEDVESGDLKPVYRSEKLFDLAMSPVPDYQLLQQTKPARLMLQTQRGCPFACEFCGSSRLFGKYRDKPIANINNELQAITRLESRPIIEKGGIHLTQVTPTCSMLRYGRMFKARGGYRLPTPFR